jgi:predicted O-methyltransferase YrrM
VNQCETEIRPGKFIPTRQGSAEVVLFEDALDGICDHSIELDALAPHPGCVRFVELVFLALLVRHMHPHRVFEIGTLQGRTTLNLALNLSNAARIFTLNLRVEDQERFNGWHKQDELLVKENYRRIGRLFRGSQVEHKIIQLWGDSLTFDFSPYQGTMDMVFIDANRQYEYVTSDSENGRKMLRPGGLLVWHDYNYVDSVTEAVDDFCRDNALECKTVSQLTIAFTALDK